VYRATTLSLLFYLGTLAITQTLYGGVFMTARWVALSALLPLAGLHWYCSRSRRHSAAKSNIPVIAAYLSMTFASVLAAENLLFSGLKWISHAAMVIVFLIFIWESLNLRQAHQLLGVLKVLVAILIFLSWLRPTAAVLYERIELFRGAFGSPNAMGQVAAIGGLLFFHSFLTGRTRWLSRAELIMALVAAWLVWSSGARSAMVASIVGIILLNYFYRDRFRGKVLWIIILTAGIAFAFPDMPNTVKRFVLRGQQETKTFSEMIFLTRASVWTSAWEGFKKRPLLGWGFGADDGISKQWQPRLTALGLVSRDNVNDTLITLESTGVVGLMAYILLVFLAIKQIPTRQQRFLIRKIHGPPFDQRRRNFSVYHVHAVAFIISMSLLVTVQFDNTALSAGNFVSVTLWLCVALAGAIKNKAVLYESAVLRYRQFYQRLTSRPMRNESIPASVV